MKSWRKLQQKKSDLQEILVWLSIPFPRPELLLPNSRV